MMDFLSFCHAHGILISAPPPIGVWRRYPTEDHPRKRNGAVKWMGSYGFAQNHAIDTEVSVWSDEGVTEAQKRDYQALANKAEQDRVRMQKDAAGKAAFILKQCQFGKHEYLKRKGFPDEEGNVWVHEGQHFLVVPMRTGADESYSGSLVGCQIIDAEGTKKFLFGQRTSGAEFCFNNHGPHILCEGYATALSIRAAMKSLKRRYTLHVCFSAGNMRKLAATLPGGLVVADNDASSTGEKTAREIGWPFWMSDLVGEDFNDYHQRVGLFKASQSLAKSLNHVAAGNG